MYTFGILASAFIGILLGFGGGYVTHEIISRKRRAEERARRHG